MERVNAILRHSGFADALGHVESIESGRPFCGHGMEHLLDVARIAYILNLESTEKNDKELIYAAALLHDLGRARQYEDETPHERESARIAAEILPECGFGETETALITEAILAHRTHSGSGQKGLGGLLYRADKLSRRCSGCAANSECDWELKNTRLEL